MIKVIIIDDEQHCIITLQHLLSKIPNVEIVATTQDSTKAKELIEKHQPNIIFIDIEMPALNGFDVINQFSNINFKIIFTTAYDHYAIKAIRLNALDYLLKPIDIVELNSALDKYSNNEMQSSNLQVQQAQKFAQQKVMDTLAVGSSDGLSFIKINDIIYLEANNSYTYIYTNDGQKNVVSKTLAVFEELLDLQQFFRAHKSYIINLKSIKKYIRGDGGEIIMNNGTSISLSRTQKQPFLDLFTKA
jgi:two-component system, LytTR family, response regulator